MAGCCTPRGSVGLGSHLSAVDAQRDGDVDAMLVMQDKMQVLVMYLLIRPFDPTSLPRPARGKSHTKALLFILA